MKPSRCPTVRVPVRLHPRDRVEIYWRAQQACLTLSGYLARMALRPQPSFDNWRTPRRHADVPAELLAKLGPDANHPCRIANLHIRVTPADYASLTTLAKSARCSLSRYLVERGCHRPVGEPDDRDQIAARRQHDRITNNLSQLYRLSHHLSSLTIPLGQLRVFEQQFDALLCHPHSHLNLWTLAVSLRHFGQQLNRAVRALNSGGQRLPDAIVASALALQQKYLIVEEEVSS